jgi:hypothetical protein
VTKAAERVMGLAGVGTIAERSVQTFVTQKLEDRCLGVNRSEGAFVIDVGLQRNGEATS